MNKAEHCSLHQVKGTEGRGIGKSGGVRGGGVSSGECIHLFALFKHKLTVMLTMTNCASTNAMKRCSGVGELGEATACAAGCMH